ncbi:transcriptional regulator, ArsR family [Parafrankia sp. EAN1pec]|uniref:ArsR/SmtB family transcription factor n=1 Tax=Parafrankia sp. (strain EAN1pec) TaxID=298653 RepID=UPI000054334B|nr:transcriptional regulator, ArsR family [Frankia sp. EAN1pec]
MSVVIVLDGAAPGRFSVAVSPLAELAACLHVLTGSAHHTEHAAWADQVTRTAPPAFRAGLGRFAPLWTALRWRAFYPGLDGPSPAAAPLAGLGIDRFAELTAYACASGYRGFDFSQVCHDPGQAAVLRHAAARLPEPHLGLAEDLLRDPEALRADILRFLDLCGRVFFGGLWAQTAPVLDRAAHLVRRRLADGGPAPALVSLSPSSARLITPSAGPARVVFDKVHHAVINPARTPLLLIPTRYGAPHLLVKNEPGLPPVVHFPVEAPEVGVTLARARLLALTDPSRVRLCRLIARQAMTTADLADRLTMTRPQVSRHLRALRELGLVRMERHGRHVLYELDVGAVGRIGRDLATALQY